MIDRNDDLAARIAGHSETAHRDALRMAARMALNGAPARTTAALALGMRPRIDAFAADITHAFVSVARARGIEITTDDVHRQLPAAVRAAVHDLRWWRRLGMLLRVLLP